ncbi:pyridoxine/pyridoxamine 5'-phosphate oxidase [Streptomyces sp. NPDC002851]
MTDGTSTDGSPGTPGSLGSPGFLELLKAQRVWDIELPAFDLDAAPDTPTPLFHAWFAEAVAAGQPEPHTMQLATVDEAGLPDVRTVMLHGADRQHWQFASHATSSKGRQLAARPHAALHFYWSALGRQIRIRGPVSTEPAAAAQADLHARSTGALAAALVGHQSELLDSYAELTHASAAAWEQAQAEPETPVPSWTLYSLAATEVEFFQGDARRCHKRLRYRRAEAKDGRAEAEDRRAEANTEDGAWLKELLWP